MDIKTLESELKYLAASPTPKSGRPEHITFADEVFSQFDRFDRSQQLEIVTALRAALLSSWQNEIKHLRIKQQDAQEGIDHLETLLKQASN